MFDDLLLSHDALCNILLYRGIWLWLCDKPIKQTRRNFTRKSHEPHGVLNFQQFDCLIKRSFRLINITDPLWEETTGGLWIPRKRPQSSRHHITPWDSYDHQINDKTSIPNFRCLIDVDPRAVAIWDIERTQPVAGWKAIHKVSYILIFSELCSPNVNRTCINSSNIY